MSYYLTRDFTFFFFRFFSFLENNIWNSVLLLLLFGCADYRLSHWIIPYFVFCFIIFQQKNKMLFRLTAGRWDINEHTDTLGRAWWDLWPFLLFLSFSTTLRSTPNKYKYGTCTTFIGTEPMRTGCSLVRECLVFLSFFKKMKKHEENWIIQVIISCDCCCQFRLWHR